MWLVLPALPGPLVHSELLPPEFADYFKLPNIFSDLAAGRGIMASTYLNDQGTVDQLRQTRQQQLAQQQQDLMAQEAALKGNK